MTPKDWKWLIGLLISGIIGHFSAIIILKDDIAGIQSEVKEDISGIKTDVALIKQQVYSTAALVVPTGPVQPDDSGD